MNVAFVWVGSFASAKEFRKYCDSSRPSGSFEGDFPFESDAESYYETFREEEETLRQAMLRLFNSAGYLDAVLAALKKAKVKEAERILRRSNAAARLKVKPDAQRPRVFYRREAESQPFVISQSPRK